MKRSSLQRRGELRPMSRRQMHWQREFNAAKPTVFRRSQGVCEAKTDVCHGFAQHVHHKLGRVGPTVNHAENLMHVCHGCHRWIHLHPLISYQRGWLLKRNTMLSLVSRPISGDASGSGHGTQGDPAAGSAGAQPPPLVTAGPLATAATAAFEEEI